MNIQTNAILCNTESELQNESQGNPNHPLIDSNSKTPCKNFCLEYKSFIDSFKSFGIAANTLISLSLSWLRNKGLDNKG